jgi:integrase
MTEEEKHTKGRTIKRRGRGEGSIYYDKKNDRYAGSFYTQEGKRRYVYGKTEKEAREKLRAIQFEERQGMLVTGPKQSVKDYLNYWLEEVHKSTLKLSTYALYRRHLDNHIIPHLGHIQLKKLTTDQVQAFCSKMSTEGLKSGTVRLLHTILYAALQDAMRWKRVAVNVCEAVKLPRYIQREVHPLDQEQARRLLQAAQGSRLDCILTLALTTGMRLGEILALRWIDIDLEERVLHVRHTVDYIQGHGWVESEPKTANSRRSILLPQVTVDALREHRASQLEARLKAGTTWKEQGLVFPNRYGGYFRRMRLYAIFKKLLQEADLPDMHFHDLRHSAATILLSMGVPAKVVQEILGHGNFSTTMNIYGHVLPSMHRDAMDEMDDFFKGMV